MPLGKIKVVVVDDSSVSRQQLVDILGADSQIEVVGTAQDGPAALKILAHRKPDVITVDIDLPRMSAFELTRRIMETQPVPVVIVSPNWRPKEEVATTFAAVEAGAVAVVGKPKISDYLYGKDQAQKLVQAVKAMSEVRLVRRWSRSLKKDAQPRLNTMSPRPLPPRIAVIAIGASTGGPLVLQTILSRLPADFSAPLLIVQHIAPGFVHGLAHWLSESTTIPVRIAAQGDIALPGRAYLAPDGRHMSIGTDGRIVLEAGAPDNGLRPSITHLFASVARSYGDRAAGVLLTGMGRDGVEKLRLMRERGALTIVQDRKSCVVYGMPGEAVALDAADYILSPEGIASFLANAVNNRNPQMSQ